ncbi:MAG TPA: sialidase family protein [Pyrinomonadaceae bacterium]|nr:sialidase family protein [Pyrinomonadaceae bacterium]
MSLVVSVSPIRLSVHAQDAKPASPSRIKVGRNVQVSSSRPGWLHYETWVAADPNNASRLIGASMAFNPDSAKWESVVYVSFNGGLSWNESLRAKDGSFNGDPVTEYGPDGSAYFVVLPLLPLPDKPETWIYRSKDGGKTWAAPTRLPFIDREAVTLDFTGGKYGGRLYLQGTDHVRRTDGKTSPTITLFTSNDGGATFTQPARLAIPEADWPLSIGNAVITAKGKLLLPFFHYGTWREVPQPPYRTMTVKVTWTSDGGATLASPVSIASFSDATMGTTGPHAFTPSIAVDNSTGPFDERLYVAWNELRGDRSQIVVASSSDNGRTWSGPVLVHDSMSSEANGYVAHQFMPVVRVNDKGVLGVMWYESNESSREFSFRVCFAASLDGGESFSTNVTASEQPYRVAADQSTFPVMSGYGGSSVTIKISPSYFTFTGGDTVGMAVDANGAFHPFWIDNRTGIPQVWTAMITVDGTSICNGDAQLAQLEDVTNRLSIILTDLKFDQKSHKFSAKLRLKNISDSLLYGPIYLRVTSINSAFGRPVVKTTDNGQQGPGTIWRFVGPLAPSETSVPRKLEFQLADPLPFDVSRLRGRGAFIDLQAKAYARFNK